jgi:FtsZ-binding cell division protein ZapB
VTTLREALQAEGMLDRELEFYSTIEAKNELLTEEVNRLRVVNAELSADRARLEREVQEANNTASAAWATADQLKDEIAKLRNTSATWATPEERTNLIKDRDWWRETAQKNVLTIEQLRGEIANLRKANSSFAWAPAQSHCGRRSSKQPCWYSRTKQAICGTRRPRTSSSSTAAPTGWQKRRRSSSATLVRTMRCHP